MSAASHPKRKSLLLFVAQAGAVLALLGVLPNARAAYSELFHAHANAVFRVLGGEQRVLRMAAPHDRRDGSDTVLSGYQRGLFEPRFTARFRIDERGYWPLLCVVALVAATPLPWPRRLLGLLLGGLLIDAFTLLQVASLGFASFGVADAGPQSTGWARALAATEGLFNSEIPRVLAVLVAWALVARPARALDAGALSRWLGGLLPGGAGDS